MRVKMLDLKPAPEYLRADQLEVGSTYYLVVSPEGAMLPMQKRCVFLVAHTNKANLNMLVNLTTNIVLDQKEISNGCRFMQCCAELVVDILAKDDV